MNISKNISSNAKISSRVLILALVSVLSLFSFVIISFFATKSNIDEMVEQILDGHINEAYMAIRDASLYQKSATPDISTVRNEILEHTVGKTGYVYVLDLKGILKVHPKLEGKNLYDAKDVNGNYFIQEIINKRDGKITYPWQNPGENSIRDKVVKFKFLPETNWIVAAGSYYDEIYASLYKFIYNLLLIALIALIVISLVTYVIYKDLKLVGYEIMGMCRSVYDSSKEIADGNTDLSSRNSEQASSLEESASTMEEITSTIKQTTYNLNLVADLANSSVKSVEDGVKISVETQQSMNDISNSSNKIADILKLVEEIAFQTNILAINAAIEAAKAGEHGKGFAVVAIEVRDLAQRASSATVDIRVLINNSLDKVKSGEVLTVSNKQKLEQISKEITKMSDLICEVTSSVKEQYAAIEQINTAISTIDSTTQQNASLVEQIASSSENLKNRSLQLDKLIRSNFDSQDTTANINKKNEKTKIA
ncbi:MAG: Cache 3/Cache 2 fusion domain-containing protein [Oligoflexia bacterium]|nr:Cache 3/Cache 2 fusion domain-containing protein [Oligoflexia bacterium]